MLKDMKDKKESMDRTVARWLAAQKGRQHNYETIRQRGIL